MSEAIKAAQAAIERAERITREIYDMVDAALDQSQQQKTIAYLSQENEVLIERIRLLEISLSSEREACAKVAEDLASFIARWRDGAPRASNLQGSFKTCRVSD